MKKKLFLCSYLLLTTSMVITVFQSCSKDDDVYGISLNKSEITLATNEKYPLIATVFPEDTIDKTLSWTSNNNAIATVSNGIITAKSEGSTSIIAKAGKQTAICDVTVINAFKDEGVVINRVKWATRNVGAPGAFAALPESTGMYYQWNRKTGWSITDELIGWGVTDQLINSNGGTSWDTTMPTGTWWEPVNDPSPAGWRLPNYAEILTLLDQSKVSYEFTHEIGEEGGIIFTDKTTGKSLIIPMVSFLNGDSGKIDRIDVGCYWSSSQSSDIASYCFFLYTNQGVVEKINRKIGLLLRSVAE